MQPKLATRDGRPVHQVQKVSFNPAGRKEDKDYGRSHQKYLTPSQVNALVKAAKAGRHGQRDALMISVAYHHALRVTELIGLQWGMINLDGGTINITRQKGGASGPQYLTVDDRRTLRTMRKANNATDDDYVFLSERGDPLTRDAFAKQLAAIGKRAGIDRKQCYPHALRHAAGHALANGRRVNAFQIQAILGHKDARSTSRYVKGVSGLIKGVWDK
jgi:type 1 fimbriae regulatory protein FimB/type 1 fimbriae regulatory protein FimE